MTKKTRLELTWIEKDLRPRLEPRILLEDPELSYHATRRVGENDIFDNRVIFGDNLLSLKALEQEFVGKIQCIYIDPPYNTGSAFERYDDGVEHSLWLSLMRDRLQLLRSLLSISGSIWVSIDDNEHAYLKVMMDEVFGRENFVACLVWEKTTSARNDAQYFSVDQEYILVYAKEKALLHLNRLQRTRSAETAYSNPDSDPRGPWREGDYKCAKSADERPNLFYPIRHPVTGEDVWPRRTRVWAYGREEHARHLEEGRLWWGKTGNYKLPKLKRFRSEAPPDLVPRTLWFAEEVGQTRTAKQEIKILFPDAPFETPKPERLLQRIIHLATRPGDFVLDSFAGSGTTGAVAHKMGRRWIMIERGEHAHTHVLPRLRKVIDGTDEGGITKNVGWKGGGGLRYFRLAPSLLERDNYGNWVVSKQYNPPMLAEAMCKHEGFTYAPSDSVYWQHGQSTERDFIFVTTQTLGREQLAQLSEEVGTDRSLLICCAAFRVNPDEFANLTIKKIPQAVLHRCEWGRDDYSLSVSQLQHADPADHEDGISTDSPRSGRTAKTRKSKASEVPELFEGV